MYTWCNNETGHRPGNDCDHRGVWMEWGGAYETVPDEGAVGHLLGVHRDNRYRVPEDVGEDLWSSKTLFLAHATASGHVELCMNLCQK